LPQIVEARDAFAGFLGAAQGWQQHGGQNGNDGNDHQQFDQRETSSHIHIDTAV
jgi:hypothetical protein